jgi:hypothetical protein
MREAARVAFAQLDPLLLDGAIFTVDGTNLRGMAAVDAALRHRARQYARLAAADVVVGAPILTEGADVSHAATMLALPMAASGSGCSSAPCPTQFPCVQWINTDEALTCPHLESMSNIVLKCGLTHPH